MFFVLSPLRPPPPETPLFSHCNLYIHLYNNGTSYSLLNQGWCTHVIVSSDVHTSRVCVCVWPAAVWPQSLTEGGGVGVVGGGKRKDENECLRSLNSVTANFRELNPADSSLNSFNTFETRFQLQAPFQQICRVSLIKTASCVLRTPHSTFKCDF